MTFRTRLTLVAAAAVALTIVLASLLVFVVVRGQLRAEVDEALRERTEALPPLRAFPGATGRFFLDIPGPPLGGAAGYVQVVDEDGETIRQRGATVPLPVNDRVRETAAGESGSFFYDTTADGTHVRVYTVPGREGYAIQVARPLTEVDESLDRIKTYLFFIALAGIGFAVALGLIVSRAALAPIRRLTEATERVTETGDLSERIDAEGKDELSRLAASYNAMLDALDQSTQALEESARAQRQLVADASHELRTPLTSLRTNFEVLMNERELAVDDRRRLLDDVVDQIHEMTTLIAGLIELARGDGQASQPEDVRLDLLTAHAVERTQRDRPGVTFSTELSESVVHGVPASLERAIGNLLDNAAKWSPAGGEVEVTVEDGTVTVRDHGPGIDEQDLPYVFDRFYRSSSARRLPGSGLGLAIVRQVAETHGGGVEAERAEGGGTRVILRLNGARANS